MFTCIRIKEEINLDFIEICVSLVFIWVHDIAMNCGEFSKFLYTFETQLGGQEAKFCHFNEIEKWKKNISLSFLKCRSWKHTLKTTWYWMPFGPLTMFITSNIVYELFPNPSSSLVNMKEWIL